MWLSAYCWQGIPSVAGTLAKRAIVLVDGCSMLAAQAQHQAVGQLWSALSGI